MSGYEQKVHETRKESTIGAPQLFRSVVFVLLVLAGSACGTSVDNSKEAVVLRAEIGYWSDTQPALLAMRDGMTPLALRLVDLQPALDRGDLEAWEELATELAPSAEGIWRDVLKVYMQIPWLIASDLPEIQRLRVEEANLKIAAFAGIALGWERDDTDLMVDSYSAIFEATAVGRSVDEMRVALVRRISEGCERIKIRECPIVE